MNLKPHVDTRIRVKPGEVQFELIQLSNHKAAAVKPEVTTDCIEVKLGKVRFESIQV